MRHYFYNNMTDETVEGRWIHLPYTLRVCVSIGIELIRLYLVFTVGKEQCVLLRYKQMFLSGFIMRRFPRFHISLSLFALF